jgi:hypothetical protein
MRGNTVIIKELETAGFPVEQTTSEVRTQVIVSLFTGI